MSPLGPIASARIGLPGILLACAALCLAPAAADAADIRTVEAVGAVPLRRDEPPRRPRRDEAVKRALLGAVHRVARDELPDYDAERDSARVSVALGEEPRDYTTRYRIVEDRGERPALFTEDPEIETEYVVLVEARIDVERVRERLRQSGLMVSSTRQVYRQRVRLVLEDVGTWASYRAVRTLLEDVGVQSAVPVEMERGRAVVDVEGSGGPDDLMAALMRAAPPNLRLVPLGIEQHTLRLRARFLDAAPASGAAAPPSSPPN